MEIYYCCVTDGSCFYCKFGVFNEPRVVDVWFICWTVLYLGRLSDCGGSGFLRRYRALERSGVSA